MRARLLGPDARVVRQVASWCLSYPDADLLGRSPLLRRAVAEQPSPLPGMTGFLDHLEGTPLPVLQRTYVEVFDLSHRHVLHLSYWTDGDTRRRGEVLAGFKRVYRDSGWLVDLRGELPDHLPTVLEFAAVVDPAAGERLLQQFRPSLELLRLALVERGTPYAGVVAAVCDTLPGASPADRAAVMAMAGRPRPTETVGLGPSPGDHDPRLLPLTGAR